RAGGLGVDDCWQSRRVVGDLDACRSLGALSACAYRVCRIGLDVDHLAGARRDHLATTHAAEGTDRCRSGCAAGLERRNRRAAARLCQGADRHRACCQSLEELAARWPRCFVSGVMLMVLLIFVLIIHLALSLCVQLTFRVLWFAW